MKPEIVRRFLPTVEVAEAITVTMPHVRVRQVLGAPVSARRLMPGDGARARDRAAAARSMEDLHTYVLLRAMSFRGRGARDGPDVLVVGQQAVINSLRGMGLPEWVDAIHFNALSGLDRWRGVACVIVLGRTLPAPKTVHELTAALTNRAPEAVPTERSGEWYDRIPKGLRLADGTAHPVEGDHHPDPLCEAVRWSICEGELVQTIGRGRGVNRTVETPLQVDILSDVCLPVVVDEVMAWSTTKPTRPDRMRTKGVWLGCAADRSRAFPGLWSSPKSARSDAVRCAPNGYEEEHITAGWGVPLVVRYQVAGPGRRVEVAYIDAGVIPDPAAWLADRLGPLAVCEVEHLGHPVVQSIDPVDDQADGAGMDWTAPEDKGQSLPRRVHRPASQHRRPTSIVANITRRRQDKPNRPQSVGRWSIRRRRGSLIYTTGSFAAQKGCAPDPREFSSCRQKRRIK